MPLIMSTTQTETISTMSALPETSSEKMIPNGKGNASLKSVPTVPGKPAGPGTRENLTPEETIKLQEAWVYLLRLSGCKEANITDTNKVPDRFVAHQNLLSNKDPACFRTRMWQSFLADHPDVTVLRFLRARKWDVEKSMAMMLEALDWREQRRIEETLIQDGEDICLKEKLTADENGFMDQYRSGKAFVRGHDKEGRPIFCIRVKLHDPKAQSGDAMEAYVLHNIESIRMMLKAPTDLVCLLFDMTGFGLKNMDFHVVKFLVQVFEARYPESLGVVLIHNAPFVFWGVWSIIKGWLDPVIASKINFTRSNSDLAKFIDLDQLHKRYAGADGWEYKYIEPKKDDTIRPGLTKEEKTRVLAEREALIQDFETITAEWVAVDCQSDEAQQLIARRNEASEKLIGNYWDLDPYIRAKTYYHRAGVVADKGKVDFQGAKD